MVAVMGKAAVLRPSSSFSYLPCPATISASARSSTRMRTASNTALHAENTSAVIHAVWISGKANPSVTTAR